MRAGVLIHRVTLQHSQAVEDDYGEAKQVYVDGPTFWARVIPLYGKEAIEQHTKQNIQGYKVRYRPRKDVSVADRLLWNGIALEIETTPIDPFGRNDEHNVTCKGLVNA